MLFDVVDEAVLILSHLEEIVVFADAFDWPVTVRAEAILDVFFGQESLVERAVPSSVVILINLLFIEKFLKVLLNH